MKMIERDTSCARAVDAPKTVQLTIPAMIARERICPFVPVREGGGNAARGRICVVAEQIDRQDDDRGLFMPGEGVEPTRLLGQRILNPPRLPFRHPGEW